MEDHASRGSLPNTLRDPRSIRFPASHPADPGTFKVNGLIKKVRVPHRGLSNALIVFQTITVTVDGSDLHLISYYTSEDLRFGRLKKPTSRPDIMTLDLPPNIFRLTNFRNPPKVETGPDGRPRLVYETASNSRAIGPTDAESTDLMRQTRNRSISEKHRIASTLRHGRLIQAKARSDPSRMSPRHRPLIPNLTISDITSTVRWTIVGILGSLTPCERCHHYATRLVTMCCGHSPATKRIAAMEIFLIAVYHMTFGHRGFRQRKAVHTMQRTILHSLTDRDRAMYTRTQVSYP